MKEKVKIFMNNKALKKKIVTALLTVSSLYFMELLEISVVEASEYTMSSAFSAYGNLLIINRNAFENLKEHNAADIEYQQLMNQLGIRDITIADVKSFVKATDNVIHNNYNGSWKLDLGENSLIISDGSASSHILNLDKVAGVNEITGSGTLKLVSKGTISYKSTDLIRLGYENNNSSTSTLNINTGKLVIDGNLNGTQNIYGINVTGMNGSGYGTELNVNCTTDMKIEKSGNKNGAFGIYMQNTVSNIKTSISMQDLVAVIQNSTLNSTGIHINNANSSGLESSISNVNFNGRVKLTAQGKTDAYGIYQTTGKNSSSELKFMGATDLETIAEDGNGYGLYSLANGSKSVDVVFEAGSNVSVASKTQSTGVYLSSTAEANQEASFKENINISAKATNGESLAIRANAVSGAKNSFSFANQTVLKIDSENNKATGIYCAATGYSLNRFEFDGDLTIFGTSANSDVSGIVAVASVDTAENVININGAATIITDGDDNDYVAQSYGKKTVINVNQKGGKRVEGLGHLYAGTGSKLNWNMDIAGSSLRGWLQSSSGGEVNLRGSNNVILEGGSQFLDNSGIINVDLQNNALWKMVASSELTALYLYSGAAVDMMADNNAYSTLTTEKLSGNGGLFKQNIDVRSMESDKIFVKGDINGHQILDIYQKDNYIPSENSAEGNGLILASVNGYGVFTAKDREGTLFYTHYDLADKISTTAGYEKDWYLDKMYHLDPSDKPTTSVDTILSANALNYHTWRTENDKLLQRMGELRENGDDVKGAWVRVKGSKIGRAGKFCFENKYTAYELGYDELTKNTAVLKRYQGAAISYTNGSGRYSSGSGDNSNKSISFYNTEIGNKGHYLDVVFKISNMDNDFTVYDTNSSRVTGDFNNTGVSLSAENGRKNALQNGWYIEPQAQFTLGYLGGDSYTTSNGIEAIQSGIKSAVGRIGFNIGKEFGNNGIVYAKANLLHEFGGCYDVTMTDSSGAVTINDSFDDTWFEYGIGAAFKTGKHNHIYFDVERSSGSNFSKDWQWNAGTRWTF